MSIVAPLFFSKRSRRFPVTVRPTVADVRIARTIARKTTPAPEEVARLLTWGADEKLLLALAATGWVAPRGKKRGTTPCGQSRIAGYRRFSVDTSCIEVAVQPDAPGQRDSARTRPWSFPVWKEGGRLPFGACPAHGSPGLCCGQPGSRPPTNGAGAGHRSVADQDRSHGALGERCGRRLRARGRHGKAAAPVDGYPNRLPDPAIPEMSARRNERACHPLLGRRCRRIGVCSFGRHSATEELRWSVRRSTHRSLFPHLQSRPCSTMTQDDDRDPSFTPNHSPWPGCVCLYIALYSAYGTE